jgi:glycerophosphoryl diester phosphodiesterase
MTREFMTIAHRGASGLRPENTLAAFRRALELGIRRWECDVRLSRDRGVVVVHDAAVDRTTNGHGLVADLTLAEIRALDAGEGERIPLLEELLAILPPDGRLVIEIKEDERFPRLTDAVVAMVHAVPGPPGRVGISAFEAGTLRRVRELSPRIELSALLRDTGPALAEALSLGVRILCPKAAEVTEELVARLHGEGCLVRAWGLKGRDEGEMERLIRCGADGMTTDYPDVLADLHRRLRG